MILQQIIQQLLDTYDDTQTECDGMTQICHTVLAENRIEHQPMAGILKRLNQEIYPHLWIDLPNGDRIDYRARIWLGNEGVPHGVFNPQDFPDVIYDGEPMELEPLSPQVFKVLTLKIPHVKFANFSPTEK